MNYWITLICFLVLVSSSKSTSIWTWNCINADTAAHCVRVKASPSLPTVSLATCRLTCGSEASLLPIPRKFSLGKEVVSFVPNSVTHETKNCQPNICSLLTEAFNIMLQTINKYYPSNRKIENNAEVPNHKIKVILSVSGSEEYLTLDTDESYTLNVTTKMAQTDVSIMAPSFFGARHALETLNQLMDYDDYKHALQILTQAYIEDAPEFAYRGILIDTARNFLPMTNLKRIVDAMSYNKLNTFHWHISDTQSFPLYLKSLPKMSLYGTYSPDEVYLAEEVKNLVLYARVRGIRIIPEFDAPAHVGHGWQWGEEEALGNLVVCLDAQPWTSYCVGPPCGQMNLANPNLYTVLGKVYEEMVEMFKPIEFFHYGGDEVHLNCWNSSQEISDWMTNNGHGLDEHAYFKQWSVFQEKAYKLLTKANKGVEVPGILWTSTLTEEGRADKHLDKNKYIIQIWTTGSDPSIHDLLQKGYRLIISNYDALYLDCGSASWVADGTNWCSPYKGWQTIFDNDPMQMAKNSINSAAHKKQILGAESPAWSEQIDEHTIDSKLWPRGSALAERLWSNPSYNYTSLQRRISSHRHRLVQRGIQAERLKPEWCRQNEGQCKMPWKPKEEKVEELEIVGTEREEYTINTNGSSDILSFNVITIMVLNILAFF